MDRKKLLKMCTEGEFSYKNTHAVIHAICDLGNEIKKNNKVFRELISEVRKVKQISMYKKEDLNENSEEETK